VPEIRWGSRLAHGLTLIIPALRRLELIPILACLFLMAGAQRS
jgi:hypothetical protein